MGTSNDVTFTICIPLYPQLSWLILAVAVFAPVDIVGINLTCAPKLCMVLRKVKEHIDADADRFEATFK